MLLMQERQGAELYQAQVKPKVILEVGMEFGDEVETYHYQPGG